VELLEPRSDNWQSLVWPRPTGEDACCIVALWLAVSRLSRGGGDHGHDPLVPFGIEPTGHAWLHSRCWTAWHAGRKAEAVAVLAAMGIAAPVASPLRADEDFAPPHGIAFYVGGIIFS
jgi:hypothetical protein